MTDPAEVERLLASAATDPVDRPALLAALKACQVWVPGWMDRPTEHGAAVPGTKVSMPVWTDDAGPFAPFFTSEPLLNRGLAAARAEDRRFVRVAFLDFLEMTRGQRLWLNPRAGHAKEFLPDEVEAILAGREPGVHTEVLGEAQEVLVGAPAIIPDGLVDVLTRFLERKPVVERAHLGWMLQPDGHAGFLLVLVAADRRSATEGLGSLQIRELTGGSDLDVMVVPASQPEHLLSDVQPFYERSGPVRGSARLRGWFRRLA